MKWPLFGKRLDAVRTTNGLLYREIAEQTGLAASVCHRAMRGSQVDYEAFERLCLWASLNPLDYFDNTEKLRKL
jgi:transcriptional regulator with XRE-family HTH domain